MTPEDRLVSFALEIRITETGEIVMPSAAVELAWATVQLKVGQHWRVNTHTCI